MSDPRLRKLDRWHVDFAAAKIALHNLDILVHNVVQGQNAVVAQLRDLFGAYRDFAGDGPEAQQAGHQEELLERTAASIRESTAKFSGKVSAQIQQAREQVSFIGKNVSKLRSAKPPQFLAAVDIVMQQVPEFLSVFDAFLARLTLELRIQQANFYKELGGAFTHAGRAEPTSSIVQTWLTQFEQIMPAVESLKYVNPQMKTLEKQLAGQVSTGEDAAILAPVKWIHARVTRDIRDFSFSDPRKGFFNKPTHPPKADSHHVVAAYDFEGQTESDLAFKRGDLIRVIDRGTADDPNWWCGDIDGRRGLFPRNYVEEQAPASPKHDEYIPRSDDVSARSEKRSRSADSQRRSEESHGSRDDVKSGMVRRSSSLRRSGSLERSAEQEDFGDFNGPAGPAEQSPKLPRRPTHTAADDTEEDEHAPNLPRRPRPSQSEETRPDARPEATPRAESNTSESVMLQAEETRVGKLSDDVEAEPAGEGPSPSSEVYTESRAVSTDDAVKPEGPQLSPSQTVTTRSAEVSQSGEGAAKSEQAVAEPPRAEPPHVPSKDEAQLDIDSDDDDLQIPDHLREETQGEYGRSETLVSEGKPKPLDKTEPGNSGNIPEPTDTSGPTHSGPEHPAEHTEPEEPTESGQSKMPIDPKEETASFSAAVSADSTSASKAAENENSSTKPQSHERPDTSSALEASKSANLSNESGLETSGTVREPSHATASELQVRSTKAPSGKKKKNNKKSKKAKDSNDALETAEASPGSNETGDASPSPEDELL